MIIPVPGIAGGLDVPFRLINECADPKSGRHNAARNQVPSPSDSRDAGLALRRLGGVLAGRLEQVAAALSGDGGAGRLQGTEIGITSRKVAGGAGGWRSSPLGSPPLRSHWPEPSHTGSPFWDARHESAASYAWIEKTPTMSCRHVSEAYESPKSSA